MREGTLPPESFRLYVDDEFYVVCIADTVRKLRSLAKKHSGWDQPKLLAGVVTATSDDLPGLVGVIYLPKDKLGAGLVAHELAHAAFRTLERRGKRRWDDADEESYALTIEHLTRSFWNEAYAHGFA